MSVPTPTSIDAPEAVENLVPEERSVFLSASVPYIRDFPDGIEELEREQNRHYVATKNERAIRGAVASFAREVVRRDLRVVFGAHPAISPMLLSALRDARRGRILIFQSKLFVQLLPQSTLDLASWDRGELLLTAIQRGPGGPTPKLEAWHQEKASLTFMRECMTRVPGLVGAVLIGGMDGVEEEARLFRANNPGYQHQCYAYGASGSAAQFLLQRDPDANSGGVPRSVLKNDLSPSFVLGRIFQDMRP